MKSLGLNSWMASRTCTVSAGSRQGPTSENTGSGGRPAGGAGIPLAVVLSFLCSLSFPLFANPRETAREDTSAEAFRAAWEQAGLTEQQAIAHAVDRLGFGARPGMLEEIAAVGLATWIESQLAPPRTEKRVAEALEHLDTLEMSSRELAETFPSPGMIARELRAMEGSEGFSFEDGRTGSRAESDAPGTSPEALSEEEPGFGDDRAQRREVMEYLDSQGYRRRPELTAQLLTQKLIRATETEFPLQEMLVDFWFNHFNVSVRDPEGGGQVLAYERDAIRPHVLGDFRTMLEATARHPAMLGYLDNAVSRAEPGQRTALSRDGRTIGGRRAGGSMGARAAGMRGRPGGGFRGAGGVPGSGRGMGNEGQRRRALPAVDGSRNTGLNENYARELLELHTLGVDGGYTQEDVVEVARAFTGWTMVPPRVLDERLRGGSLMERIGASGFVIEGLFVFHPGFHDAEKKKVLGHRLKAGRGIEDGREVLDIVAAHPSTARHLSHKLAVRFVADEPSEAVVDALAATFSACGGDLTEWMRTLIAHPEFWASRGAKVRTPFEYVAASIRALDGEFRRPDRELFGALEAMGQLPYSYDAPTGFSDQGEHWLGSGVLLARMNFATSLVKEEVGVQFDSRVRQIAARAFEEGGTEKALEAVVQTLLPGHDPKEIDERLTPLIAQFEGEAGLLESMVAWTLGSPAFQQR